MHASRVRTIVGLSRVAVLRFDVKKKSLVLAILGLFVDQLRGSCDKEMARGL